MGGLRFPRSRKSADCRNLCSRSRLPTKRHAKPECSRLGRQCERMTLDELMRGQAGIVHRQQALAAGMTRHALEHRLGAGGSWQAVLPAVYAAFTGDVSERQRQVAALLYAAGGEVDDTRAMLGGPTALAVHGLPVSGWSSRATAVHLLVAHAVRVRPQPAVAVRRTTSMPTSWTRGGLPVAPVARAVVDTCRLLPELRSVRAVVAQAVQTGRTTVPALSAEAVSGGSAGSRLIRIALEEVGAGARSAPEAAVLRAIRRYGLPEPHWNIDLYAADGTWLARPDAWWREANTVLEIDSIEWHLEPERWQRTMRRHEFMTMSGLLVIHATPSRVYTDLAGLLRHVATTLDVGRTMQPARVRTAACTLTA